jgi:hypothetical protein
MMPTDITELLSFRDKSLLAGDLNAKHLFWNSVVSNPSGAKLLNLLHIYEFEIKCAHSELLYDWRFTANQFVLAPSPLSITTRVLTCL